MGFDIECIIDIQSYPGEYFCPVCRTLVYPNEALQVQCTHVYCKPCLAHIANGSRACPYDGYLVSESESKPLVESDKTLAEKIGKVKVHCLFFRSGCTWEGTLSDCASHGSGCSFGNSPVICNRCGIQIVHRQVHDHAQVCPGVYDGQMAVVGRSATSSSTVTAVVNQSVAQTGVPVSQAQNPQIVAATPLPVQNPNVSNSLSQTHSVAPAALPAQEQWYQQQYQQYYQHYVGYDPYQQQQQQYYAYQQQPFQQYQQQQVQVSQQQAHLYSQVAGQPQTQSHQQAPAQSQPQSQPQFQPQTQPQQHLQIQPNLVPQAPQQPHSQTQPQGPAQTQSHSLPQLLPPGQLPVQLPPQGQAQAHASMQAISSNYQVNTPQQLHPALRPQNQILQQGLPPPPTSQSTQPPQYSQAVSARPLNAQHLQVPQFQQPQVPMNPSQASQAHLQPQMHPQPQPYTQSSNQSNMQAQPQPQPYQSQPQPHIFNPQSNQSVPSGTLPQVQPQPVPPVSGLNSYQQPLPAQKMQPGASQPHLGHSHQASGSIHSVQAHGQVPQQPAPMRPSQSQGPVTQQPPQLPLLSKVPGVPPAPNQQFLPYGQQPTYPGQLRPLMQPAQQVQPPSFTQQQQYLAPFQGQTHQQVHLPPGQTMQSQMQMRTSGPPQPQQSQNYVGTPMMSNQGIYPQSHHSSGGFDPLAPSGPVQLVSSQTSACQNHAKPSILEQNASGQEIRSPSKRPTEKSFEGESLKEDVGAGQSDAVLKYANNAGKDGLVKSVVKRETDDMTGALEQSHVGKSSESGTVEEKFRKEEVHSLTDSVSIKQGNLENQMNFSITAVTGQSSANHDRQSLSAAPASSAEGHLLPPRSHSSHKERSPAQVDVQPSSFVALPHQIQMHSLAEGKGPGDFGGTTKSFESQSGPQGSERYGFLGSAPPRHFEGHYGSQQVREVETPRDHMFGSVERVPHMKPYADEPNFLRANGGPAPDTSMFVPRDEYMKPMSREQLNLYPREPTRPLEQVSRSLDKQFLGPVYDAGSKLDPGDLGPHSRFLPHRPPSGGHGHWDLVGPGPEFGQHHIKPFLPQSPGGDYIGSPPRRFAGPSSFPRGTSSLDDFSSRDVQRFPPLPGHVRRGDIDGPLNSGFGEHRPPALSHNQIGSDDVYGADGPANLMRGKLSGQGYLPGHFNMGDSAGPGTFPGHGYAGEGAGNFPRPPFPESVGGEVPGFLPFRDPAMRNNYSFHGFPNAGKFSGVMDSIDQSRKRKPPTTGWCRICELDCETVEGLEIHSQTREHQSMAMDMVKSIKLKNKKKHRASAGRMVHEGGSRSRKVGSAGRGSKP